MNLQSWHGDFHIHIGATEKGNPVKISASRQLTFLEIAKEASERKGIDMIGLIDCHSPEVLDEMRTYLRQGWLEPLHSGGLRFANTTIIPGTEIELKVDDRPPFHVLAYFPTFEAIEDFSSWMKHHLKNIHLSSQRIYVSPLDLQEEVVKRNGIFIPAHIFTPHKSIYGSAANRLSDLLNPDLVTAVELGLSADTEMAGYISELDAFPFLTNSDAHSLPKIAREYNRLALLEPTFDEWVRAMQNKNGRKIEANYGLNPHLGKYHRTFCNACQSLNLQEIDTGKDLETIDRCPHCGSEKIVRGVFDRILDIGDRNPPIHHVERPPYYYQVPLEFIPGLGPKKLNRLLEHFGTEMNVLHRVPIEEIGEVVGQEVAHYIQLCREGRVETSVGGGGRYGKVL